jgi:hypothetical protein
MFKVQWVVVQYYVNDILEVNTVSPAFSVKIVASIMFLRVHQI